jgi:hypothetical protein
LGKFPNPKFFSVALCLSGDCSSGKGQLPRVPGTELVKKKKRPLAKRERPFLFQGRIVPTEASRQNSMAKS